MSNLILPQGGGKPVRPPNIMLEYLAQQRLIERYESLLESWSRVLCALAAHASELERGKKVRRTEGGFKIPHKWQADLPPVCDLNVVEDEETGEIVVRLLTPSPRVRQADTDGWVVPNEDAVAERESASPPSAGE